ncbi:MAG: hypothetical protein U0Q16_16840 [Bryobacteraceae bacterium]
MRILAGTKKGAWILETDSKRRDFKLSKPIQFGQMVTHFVQDPREPKRLLIAAKPGHLGPTIFRSSNGGKSWAEPTQPPAFAKAAEGAKGLVVDHITWLTPGHSSEPGVWFCGSSPQGLFRSEDHGATWTSVDGFNQHPMRDKWCGAGEQGPPDGARMHSILVDPRDAKHMYLGMSAGGVFETTDGGSNWAPINKGCDAEFLPSPDADYGHDPHCVRLHPLNPDRLYQQNHCGIYRMDRAEGQWQRIGRNMPKKIGDIGFPCVLHPRDPDTMWVFPMDGTTVWPRTSVEGKPAVYRTRNGGKKWERLDKGLPKQNAWYTVFRQAMTADDHKKTGLYFGTTSGEIWASRDEGESWRNVAMHLPRVLSLEVAH